MKRLTAKQYATALLQAHAEAEPNHRVEVVHRFLKLMIRRRSTKLVPRIITHIQALQDEADQLTRVQTWSATAVDQQQISVALERLLGKVALESFVQTELLGGLRIKVGDTVVDGTLKNRLQRLQTHLSGT